MSYRDLLHAGIIATTFTAIGQGTDETAPANVPTADEEVFEEPHRDERTVANVKMYGVDVRMVSFCSLFCT